LFREFVIPRPGPCRRHRRRDGKRYLAHIPQHLANVDISTREVAMCAYHVMEPLVAMFLCPNLQSLQKLQTRSRSLVVENPCNPSFLWVLSIELGWRVICRFQIDGLTFCGSSSMAEQSYSTITRHHLEQRVRTALPDNQDAEQGYALVNVLKPEAFEREHIPGRSISRKAMKGPSKSGFPKTRRSSCIVPQRIATPRTA